LHTGDGRQLWDAKVQPGPWKLSDLRGGYTAPTPACDGQRVYVAFGSAVVAALDLQGNPVWRKEVVPFDFDVAWGASPLVYRDTVIVTCDEKKGSFIAAYDGATGKVRWKTERPKAGWAHSTPLLAKIAGKIQLLTAAENALEGLDPATGEALWSYRGKERVGDTVTPVSRDGLLYVDSGRGGGLGGVGVAIDATGHGDVSKTPPKWKVPTPSEGFSSPLILGEFFYRLSAPGVLTCRKWATGEEVYKNQRLEGIDHAVSPVATADGRIYCASAGRSYVVKAGPTFEIIGSGELGDPGRASPAIAGGRIYLKGSRFLFCVGKK
jgi:outer membrane protein assembly factor BamB